ncbi:hypothetical protein SLEP1_g31623 [Rubroshorea leprosula]|uniref:Uncharacterized protein n=1 Tax=Rubroshorea leprosula TaxID=152421 RepID=A0AAV5K8U9_9ROSI|nr:hypothetical protein SLEP1_g31623 [Rubroshorea leprosula]
MLVIEPVRMSDPASGDYTPANSVTCQWEEARLRTGKLLTQCTARGGDAWLELQNCQESWLNFLEAALQSRLTLPEPAIQPAIKLEPALRLFSARAK